MKKLIAISAAIAMLVVTTSVSADFGRGGRSSGQQNSSTIDIDVSNVAIVSNVVDTTASTGGNTANGGDADSDADADGSGNSNAASSATGGNGGIITTGSAGALSDVANAVNSTEVEVTATCDCENQNSRRRGQGSKSVIDVDVSNLGVVANDVDTKAKTGYNTANGDDADSDADASSSTQQQQRRWRNSRNNNSSSNADSVATGGNGGDILTGAAESVSLITNVVNTNIVRVTR